MPQHSLSKEGFPNAQSKPSIEQFKPIPSHPIAGYLGEEINNILNSQQPPFRCL